MLLVSQGPEFHSIIHSMTNRFGLTGHFDTSALNAPKWPWTLQGQRYPIFVSLVLLSAKFHSALLYNKRFLRYKVAKNHKCTECPHTDKNLMVKSTLYTHKHYPLRLKFWSVSLYDQLFAIARYLICYKFPIDYNVKRPPKKSKIICQKLKSHISFNKFGKETYPRSMWMLWNKSVV